MPGKLAVVRLIIAAIVIGTLGCDHHNSRDLPTIKISDIKVSSQTDSVSFALGVVWARGIGRIGLKNMTYAFYLGVNDVLCKDSTVMGIRNANDYLNKRIGDIRDATWPRNDSNTLIRNIALKSKCDSFSYALGYAWCRGAHDFGIEEVSPALIPGLFKRFNGDTSIFTNYMSANNYLMKYVEERRLAKFGDIKKKNEDWLIKNAKAPGVKMFDKTIQYSILKSGNGATPGPNDIVECYYVSKTIDGKVYQNYTTESYKFYVFATMPGISKVIQTMKEGDRWEIYLPSNLAYGSGGVYNVIPPYSTLIIELELIKVIKNQNITPFQNK